MSYTTTTKLYCKFANTSLFDEVIGSNLTYTSSDADTPQVVTRPNGHALQLDTSISMSSSRAILSGATGFSIGFFLKSVSPGVVESSPPTGTEPLRIALLSESLFPVVSTTTSLNQWVFVAWEETQGGGYNVMKVAIHGATTATTVSTPYFAGAFNHFWFAYNGAGHVLKIFRNGVDETDSVTGTVPTSLSVYSTSFEINKGIDGEEYNISRNEGNIYELVVATVSITDTATISRAMTLGVDYVFNTTFQLVDELYETIQFDDPSTVQVNAVLSDNADIYLARSDGKLVKASRELWKFRRDFAGAAEKELLESTNGTDSNVISVDKGVVTVKTAVIRS